MIGSGKGLEMQMEEKKWATSTCMTTILNFSSVQAKAFRSKWKKWATYFDHDSHHGFGHLWSCFLVLSYDPCHPICGENEGEGEPKIIAKRDCSVSNSAWESIFKMNLDFHFTTWKLGFFENLRISGKIRYPNGPIGYRKKSTIRKEACIVHVGAVIHNH